MKIAIFSGIIGMMLPMVSHAQSAEEPKLQRVYVHPSQLGFTEGEMFAYIEEEWVPLDAVYSDASGLLAVVRKDPNHSPWWCSTCNYRNNGWDKTCKREYADGTLCGNRRPW